MIPLTLAQVQVCGEAQYTGDAPLPANTLHAALVTSTVPHAKLVSVDAAAALEMPGMIAFYSAKDVPGSNVIGPAFPDEECFATEVVTCVGHPIGVIVAETHALALKGAAAVKVRLLSLGFGSRNCSCQSQLGAATVRIAYAFACTVLRGRTRQLARPELGFVV